MPKVDQALAAQLQDPRDVRFALLRGCKMAVQPSCQLGALALESGGLNQLLLGVDIEILGWVWVP